MSIVRPGWAVAEWAHWRLLKPTEDEQRRTLGLPRARHRAVRRIVESGALEIQAYDEVFFPGLAAELGQSRPLVGSMTLQLPAEVDDDVSAWVAEGTPPVYFGFGSMPVDDPGEAVAMISDVSAELGERALICSGALEIGGIREAAHVKVVRTVNHARIFPDAAPSSTTAVPAPPPPASARGSDPGAVGRSRPAGVGKGRPAPGGRHLTPILGHYSQVAAGGSHDRAVGQLHPHRPGGGRQDDTSGDQRGTGCRPA